MGLCILDWFLSEDLEGFISAHWGLSWVGELEPVNNGVTMKDPKKRLRWALCPNPDISFIWWINK